ncbi:uncharacterized protein LOC123377261 [Mauremys mutica]|nr:uncharacterized protein LOC123377261 [Mauremys mutica]XP_044885863.1 uncharacterized protein LOC123377261 [Mauremys mutica]
MATLAARAPELPAPEMLCGSDCRQTGGYALGSAGTGAGPEGADALAELRASPTIDSAASGRSPLKLSTATTCRRRWGRVGRGGRWPVRPWPRSLRKARPAEEKLGSRPPAHGRASGARLPGLRPRAPWAQDALGLSAILSLWRVTRPRWRQEDSPWSTQPSSQSVPASSISSLAAIFPRQPQLALTDGPPSALPEEARPRSTPPPACGLQARPCLAGPWSGAPGQLQTGQAALPLWRPGQLCTQAPCITRSP